MRALPLVVAVVGSVALFRSGRVPTVAGVGGRGTDAAAVAVGLPCWSGGVTVNDESVRRDVLMECIGCGGMLLWVAGELGFFLRVRLP
jgi:hypothetical protein